MTSDPPLRHTSMGLCLSPPTITAAMIPIPLLRQLDDQNLAFVLTRVPTVPPQYRWVCRIGPEGDDAIRGFGYSATEAISEATAQLKKSPALPSDLNYSWCLP